MFTRKQFLTAIAACFTVVGLAWASTLAISYEGQQKAEGAALGGPRCCDLMKPCCPNGPCCPKR